MVIILKKKISVTSLVLNRGRLVEIDYRFAQHDAVMIYGT